MKNIPLIYVLIVFSFFLTLNTAISQSLKGTVKDLAQGEAVAYVNIGIKNKDFGTVSDSLGNFQLTFTAEHIDDTVTFLHVSYESKEISVKDLLIENEVILKEKMNILKELIITSKRPKRRKIGIRTHNPLLWGGLGIGENDIFEIAQEIKTTKQLRLLDFNLFLRIYQDSLPYKFRLKIYSSEAGVPGEILINDNIIIDGIVPGWNKVDLEAYQIILKDDFFVSVEFLPVAIEKVENVYAGGVLIGGNRYSRSSSLGTWNKAQGGYKLYVTSEDYEEGS